jgi:hypothetical protein
MILQSLSGVTLAELKQLLHTISDYRLNVCFRYRLIGEMWQQNFMRILKITDSGLFLNDEVDNRLIVIRDLSHLMQFELDSMLHSYQPHYHYSVHSTSLDLVD